MALNRLRRPDRFITEQNMNDPLQQTRCWECFQCACHQMYVVSPEDGARHICQILDVDNRKIEQENERIINPAMRKPLKKCPFHPELE